MTQIPVATSVKKPLTRHTGAASNTDHIGPEIIGTHPDSIPFVTESPAAMPGFSEQFPGIIAL